MFFSTDVPVQNQPGQVKQMGSLVMNQQNHSLPSGIRPPQGPQQPFNIGQVTSTSSNTMASNNQQVQFTSVPNSSMQSMTLNQQQHQVASGPNSGPGLTSTSVTGQVTVPCTVPGANLSPVSSSIPITTLGSSITGVTRPTQAVAPPPPYTTTSTLPDNVMSVTSSSGMSNLSNIPLTSMPPQSTSSSVTNNSLISKENSFPQVSQSSTITTSANSENRVVPTSVLNSQSSLANHSTMIPVSDIKTEGKPFTNIKSEPMETDVKREVPDPPADGATDPPPIKMEIKEEPEDETTTTSTPIEENAVVKEENVSIKTETSPAHPPGTGNAETNATSVAANAEKGKGDKPQNGSKSVPATCPISTSTTATVTPAPPTPVSFKKDRQPLFEPDELRLHLLPTLDKLFKQDPESIPFRQPVDPSALGIPDYFDIVKKPMDMSTIKRKLDTGLYTDPWDYVDDVWLMFDNAWLYNRKTSRVYRYCTKVI